MLKTSYAAEGAVPKWIVMLGLVEGITNFESRNKKYVVLVGCGATNALQLP